MAHQVPVGRATLLWAALLLVPRLGAAGTYHGQVVDTATGEPLSDAVAVVEWVKRPIAYMDGEASFHDVKETVTDAQGYFAISCWRRVDWNPLTFVIAPRIIVYKPGYEPLAPAFTTRRGFSGFDDMRSQLRRGTVVRLSRLTPEQAERFAKVPGMITDVDQLGLASETPYERISELVRLINLERRRLGFGPIGDVEGGQQR